MIMIGEKIYYMRYCEIFNDQYDQLKKDYEQLKKENEQLNEENSVLLAKRILDLELLEECMNKAKELKEENEQLRRYV